MSADSVTPIQPQVEKLKEIRDRLGQARSALRVAGLALDGGETDLEAWSADVVNQAAEDVDCVYSELLMLCA